MWLATAEGSAGSRVVRRRRSVMSSDSRVRRRARRILTWPRRVASCAFLWLLVFLYSLPVVVIIVPKLRRCPEPCNYSRIDYEFPCDKALLCLKRAARMRGIEKDSGRRCCCAGRKQRARALVCESKQTCFSLSREAVTSRRGY